MASIQKRGKNMLSFILMKIPMVRNDRNGNPTPQKKKQQNEKQLLKMKLTMALSSRPAVPQSECSL